MKRFLLLITLIQFNNLFICQAQLRSSANQSKTTSAPAHVNRSPAASPSNNNSHGIIRNNNPSPVRVNNFQNTNSSRTNSHIGNSNNNSFFGNNQSNNRAGNSGRVNNAGSFFSGSNNNNTGGIGNTNTRQPARVIPTHKVGRPVYPKVATTNSNTTHLKRLKSPRLPSLAGYSAPVSVYYPTEPYYPYQGYYGYNPYYNNPYFYNPYFDMMSMGMSFMFTPHYCLGRPVVGGYNSYNDNNYQDAYDNSPEVSSGYVVYENDTINGNMIIGNRSIRLSAADSLQDYEYVFRDRKKGLKYVMATNEDQKELDLVRLGDNEKKLYRIIHLGKLNIYDEGRGFIYKPEDIQANTITVVYNGEVISLESHNLNQTKLRLASFINKAYNTDINPNNMDWNSLLIFIDKLD